MSQAIPLYPRMGNHSAGGASGRGAARPAEPMERILARRMPRGKRCADIVLSAAGLAVLLPLLAALALLVKATSPGPVFFGQERVGIGGRRFTMYKFRSMGTDAETTLAGLKHLNERKGPVFKMKNDPRVTPAGKWLRSWSLDELPQLYNVLRGDMSLVGPRPPIPAEVEQYQWWQRRRLDVIPGITGLWQVRARHKPDFDEWVRLDIEYIENWSHWMDGKILLATLPAVLYKARGC